MILYGLVAFAVIFIDLESETLHKYSAPQFAETRETALVGDATETNLGLIQNNQLQQQWMEYESRTKNLTNDVPIAAEEVVVTVEEHKSSDDSTTSPSPNDSVVLGSQEGVVVTIGENHENENNGSADLTNDESDKNMTRIDEKENKTLILDAGDKKNNITSSQNQNNSYSHPTKKETGESKNITDIDGNENNYVGDKHAAKQNITSSQNENNSSSNLTKNETGESQNVTYIYSNETNIYHDGSHDSCFFNNSKTWQQGPRWSNVVSSNDDDDRFIVENPLLFERMPGLLSSSICNQNSKFLNPNQSYWDITDEALLDEWEFRLIYLAIHHHHHAPALQEKKVRLRSKSCSSSSEYECPSARYLVTTLPGAGLGAVFRTAALMSVLMGVATNRITVFVNNYVPETNSKNGTNTPLSFLQKPSQLFSCPRRDMQCVFLPTSPCVLTKEALESGVVMPEVDARDLRRQGKLNKQEYHDAHVLIIEPRISTPKKWSIQGLIQEKLYRTSLALISKLPTESDTDLQKIAVLKAAAKRILHDTATIGYHPNNSTNDFVYSNRYTKTAHAGLLYLMRLNPHYQQLSDKIVDQIFKNSTNPNPTFGLPIRGSDKCHRESECLQFDAYMNLTREEISTFTRNEAIKKNATTVQNATRHEANKPTVILTTEDGSISRARREYEQEFNFIINEHDKFQGTGRVSMYGNQADDIMLSSMVALKMQFLATQKVVGNCCSNFHLLLFDLLNEQCGLSSKPLCLQEHPNPNYRPCCQWTQSEECDLKREAAAAEKARKVAEEKAQEAVAEKE